MKIGILGYGTVGSGAGECLGLFPNEKAQLHRIFDMREIGGLEGKLTNKAEDIIDSGDIDIVVETMGGEEPAYTYVKRALSNGKNVVSANKLMISRHFDELVNLAREKGVSFSFSAAAGGSIPWLFNLLRIRRLDNIKSVGGIMNGTTNFILDAMQTGDGADFDEVLSQAQALGYAEADPTADIDGLDVKAKIALSCDIAYGRMIDPEGIPALGIRYIKRRDIAYFRTLGYNCRLIGRGEKTEGGVAVYVEPMLFTPEAVEYNVKGAGNIISYDCSRVGKQSYFGQGAGKEPTGGAIVNDIYDIAAGISVFDTASCDGRLEADNDKVYHKYYVRTKENFDKEIVCDTLAEDVFITKEISVTEAHRLAGEIIKAGNEIFIASIAE